MCMAINSIELWKKLENLPLGPLSKQKTYLQYFLYIARSKTMLWDRGQHNNHRKAVTTQKDTRERKTRRETQTERCATRNDTKYVRPCQASVITVCFLLIVVTASDFFLECIKFMFKFVKKSIFSVIALTFTA